MQLFYKYEHIVYDIAQGVANPNYSGSLTSLSHLATTLEPGKGDPVILFENHERYGNNVFLYYFYFLSADLFLTFSVSAVSV